MFNRFNLLASCGIMFACLVVGFYLGYSVREGIGFKKVVDDMGYKVLTDNNKRYIILESKDE